MWEERREICWWIKTGALLKAPGCCGSTTVRNCHRQHKLLTLEWVFVNIRDLFICFLTFGNTVDVHFQGSTLCWSPFTLFNADGESISHVLLCMIFTLCFVPLASAEIRVIACPVTIGNRMGLWPPKNPWFLFDNRRKQIASLKAGVKWDSSAKDLCVQECMFPFSPTLTLLSLSFLLFLSLPPLGRLRFSVLL